MPGPKKIEKNMGKIWSLLKMGYTLKLDDRVYAVVEDENGTWRFCIKADTYTCSDKEAHVDPETKATITSYDVGITYIYHDISIDEFDKLVQRIPDDDYFLLTSQAALTRMKRDRIIRI